MLRTILPYSLQNYRRVSHKWILQYWLPMRLSLRTWSFRGPKKYLKGGQSIGPKRKKTANRIRVSIGSLFRVLCGVGYQLLEFPFQPSPVHNIGKRGSTRHSQPHSCLLWKCTAEWCHRSIIHIRTCNELCRLTQTTKVYISENPSSKYTWCKEESYDFENTSI